MSALRICVLRGGGEYTPDHVRWLAAQIPGLHVLTDQKVDGVPSIALQHQWPGWWSKIELFDPGLDSDLLYFDLDTVVLGGLERLERGRTTVLSDFYRPRLIGSGLMYIAQRDKARVWEAFTDDPAKHMRRCTTRENWGDQGFLLGPLARADRWQGFLPGHVQSYKRHILQLKQKPQSVVCFHGQPRPWDAKESWVPALEKVAHATQNQAKISAIA